MRATEDRSCRADNVGNPADDAPLPGPNEAMVRVAHSSPNVDIEVITLRAVAGAPSTREFDEFEYRQVIEYVPVPVGSCARPGAVAGGAR